MKTTTSVLITGANRGLGLEWARQYAEAGWRVPATCRRPEEADDLKSLADRHPRLSVHRLDVTDSEQLRTLQLDLEEARIDVLLNNAGVYLDKFMGDLGGIDYGVWQRSFAVNTLGAVRVSEAFVEQVAPKREKTAGDDQQPHGIHCRDRGPRQLRLPIQQGGLERRHEGTLACLRAARHRRFAAASGLGENPHGRPRRNKTDMAVVVSAGQNEIEQMAKLGIDIVPHRKRINDEKLDEKFKDANDPLRLVFVCAMWLTGFDAPSCSTIYLDKPMRNHTLMQTIARANRVYPGKHSGLIVDYANVFASLEKALAIYGQGAGGAMPVRDEQALADELRYAVNDANVYCLEHGVALAEIESMPTAHFAQAGAINAAADRLMAPETVKRDFLALEALVRSLYGAVKPDPVAIEFAQRCGCLAAIAECIRTVSDPPDISHIMQGIQDLLDESIAAEPFKIRQPIPGYGQIDLSKINFEALGLANE
jgi:NAD(P)-dependent dehydrogenase (short-subunit alcohol dehydrogenase family)